MRRFQQILDLGRLQLEESRAVLDAPEEYAGVVEERRCQAGNDDDAGDRQIVGFDGEPVDDADGGMRQERGVLVDDQRNQREECRNEPGQDDFADAPEADGNRYIVTL